MKLSTFLPALSLLSPALSQSTAYTDKASGITFQLFTDSKTGYFFGAALPQTPTTDFIGIIGGKGTGWSGVSLGGEMVGKLLIAAWPNGNATVSSFRKATSFAPPPVATGTFTQTAIANGTYINSTHWSYTFVCGKCIDSAGSLTFKPTDTSASIGWAGNSAAPSKKTDPTASISKHAFQGKFKLDLASAKSANYATWAGYTAKNPVAFKA